MNLERPVTAKYIADLLGVTTPTVLSLAVKIDNPLPHIKIGTRYRFFMSDVVKYFNLPADKFADTKPEDGATNE